MFSGKTVLVTGGTGFLGGRLVEMLVDQGAQVRVLVRRFVNASRLARFPLEMIAGDVTDSAAVLNAARGCDVIFHCAYGFEGTNEVQRQVGVEGTRNVSEAALKAGVSRLVHVSTFAVYFAAQSGDLTEKSLLPENKDPYVRIKREAEQLLMELHKIRGLPVAIVQPTLIYGPFSAQWTINPLRMLKTGKVPLVDGGEGYCNPVYIDDVVQSMFLAATSPKATGETFLISGEDPITWKEFYQSFQDLAGKENLCEISSAQIDARIQAARRRPGTLAQILALSRQPEVFPQLVGLPAMSLPLRMIKRALSDNQWNGLKNGLLGISKEDGNGQPKDPILLPGPALLRMYKTRTRVRIDKARELLGYAPQFDFQRGMTLAAQFLRWANLA